MRGLPDFGFLGSLSLEHRPQEVKPGSKHRYGWDIPADTMWPLNLLVGGHLTLKKVTELSQKDSSIWSFNFSGAPAFFHRLSGREKRLASNDYSRSLLTLNLQIECLLKVKTKMSTRTIPPHVAQHCWMSQVLNREYMEQSFWMTDSALLSQNLFEFVTSGLDWPAVILGQVLHVQLSADPVCQKSTGNELFLALPKQHPACFVFLKKLPDHSMNVSEGQESWLAFQKDAELSQASWSWTRSLGRQCLVHPGVAKSSFIEHYLSTFHKWTHTLLQSILRGSWGHRNCKTDRGPGPHQKDMPWKISS